MVRKRPVVRMILGLLCGGLLVAAVLSPWWRITIASPATGRSDSITAYPYTLRGQRLMDMVISSGEYLGPTQRTREMTAHTVALATGAALCFLGAILKGKKGIVALAAAGIIVLPDVFLFVRRIQDICETHYNMPMQGSATVVVGLGPFEVTTALLPGLYLATGAGILALISAFLSIVLEK